MHTTRSVTICWGGILQIMDWEDFDEVGFALITLRNGNLRTTNIQRHMRKKLLYIREGQMAPMHFHWDKMEDIINRAEEMC